MCLFGFQWNLIYMINSSDLIPYPSNLCVFVFMYAYVSMLLYVYVCVYIYVYKCAFIFVSMCLYIAYDDIFVYMCLSVFTPVSIKNVLYKFIC